MDKNWMKMGLTADGRISRPYFDGVSLFIQFARAVIDGQGECNAGQISKVQCVKVQDQLWTISEAMRWHLENPGDGEELRHPAQSDEWKDFDVKHPEFALEPRNVRLGLAVVDELKELWQTGALTYDAFGRKCFQMRAALSWTIHDWPAFGDISGWRTKGHYSCYTCNDEPYFESLRSKTAYINRRCYLPENHPERRKRVAYNGKQEKRKRSLDLPVEKIQEQLNNITGVTLGKYPANKKRPRHKPNWTKISILYELPYFRDKKFRHNIDLWLTQHPNGSYIKPHASFSLTIEEREAFFEFLKSVKYPDGYAANISRSVHSTNGRLTGLKSHDYHILIQQILPIGMRGFVNKEISTTLFELGSFFQDLCSKTLRRSELEKLEERIVHILCKLEKIFPPAFFDVMVHLAIHLPREALLGGPVQYRWMYPFERFLGALKKFVSNRARPEGSIAEAYIVKECITFCSMYLDGYETVYNRPEQNEDYGPQREGYTVFTETTRPIGLITRDGEMSQELRDIAHWFVLFNSPEIKKYLEEHNNLLHVSNGQDITNIQRKDFPKWFKEQVRHFCRDYDQYS
ncbi:hypothetical protein Acr_00g0028460 [Actinidia rufa]|uniref:DUF4218 domain-containing protein n=1 Tax=Actinidia rufa TaxID=165716 RepID=A0A7J0DE87_9ERIC|nr:hypothetical protein Acr_00g0028460 [Actinidia rufa]